MNGLMGDGSVRFLAQNIGMSTYRAIASREEGESITLD
jgi:hypothetical protein